MEAAIRWAPGPSPDAQRYLLVDVAGNAITLNESRTEQNGDLVSERIARYDKVPNFTAFDWSKTDTSLLALGLSSGDAALLSIDAQKHTIVQTQTFPIRTQRKANSIAFNTDRLLALGLDRVRTDHCLNIYDVDSGSKEPLNKLCTGEAVSSVRFWPNHPQEMIAAVARSTLRLFDVREAPLNSLSNASTVFTKQVHNIAIDPIDDNYFCSGGSTSDPVVSVWDRRWLTGSPSSGSEQNASAPVLELRPAVDNSQTATVWSIRFSGLKRGRFAVLASTGAVRLYDVNAHSVEQNARYNPPANFHGGNPWTGTQYISKTHDIQYPYYDKTHGHDEGTRVIAFDWVNQGVAEGQAIMALRLTREVNMFHAPKPFLMNVTARDDLALCREDLMVIEPKKNLDTTPEQIEAGPALERHASQPLAPHEQADPRAADAAPLNAKALESFRESKPPLQRTEHWLHDSAEAVVPAKNKFQPIADVLALVNIHKKRCMEGYRFDCALNKEIVKEDPKLHRLWTNIGHFQLLAANDGMVTETLDMSYYGVQNIWNEKMGESRNRLLRGTYHSSANFEAGLQYLNRSRGRTSEQNLPAKTYNKRLLCLELCGWTWDNDSTRHKAEYLVGQQQFYRAIALAFFDGYKGIALEVLKKLSKTITDNGLSILLASDTVSDQQKEICSWMESEARDPYLRAMLRYIAHQDWHSVVNDPTLHLSDRVSLALKYLKDADLTKFISTTTANCIKAGDVSGVLLTGLTESCVPLFQNYLTRTGDLQTVVLATSFTSPLYMSNMRLSMWKETYLDLLQAWRCFIERTRFNVEHAKRSVRRDGSKAILPVAPQIGLRCLHCNGSLARPAEDQGQKAVMHFDSPSTSGTSASQGSGAQQAAMLADASGTVCPRCGRHLPRCAVCLQWLGIPELVTVAARKSKASTLVANGSRAGDESKLAAAAQKAKEMDVALSRFVTFCAGCGHGLHAHHARQWFAKHGMCPVPDCGCLCGVRR